MKPPASPRRGRLFVTVQPVTLRRFRYAADGYSTNGGPRVSIRRRRLLNQRRAAGFDTPQKTTQPTEGRGASLNHPRLKLPENAKKYLTSCRFCVRIRAPILPSDLLSASIGSPQRRARRPAGHPDNVDGFSRGVQWSGQHTPAAMNAAGLHTRPGVVGSPRLLQSKKEVLQRSTPHDTTADLPACSARGPVVFLSFWSSRLT